MFNWIFKILGSLKIKLPGYKEEVEEDYIFQPEKPEQKSVESKKRKSYRWMYLIAVLFVLALFLFAYYFVLQPQIAKNEGTLLINQLNNVISNKKTLESMQENLNNDELVQRLSVYANSFQNLANSLAKFNNSYATKYISIGQYTVIAWGVCKSELGYYPEAISKVESYFNSYQNSITNKDMYYYYLSKWYRNYNIESSKHYVELAKRDFPNSYYTIKAVYEDAISETNIEQKIANLNAIVQNYNKNEEITVLTLESLGDTYLVKALVNPSFIKNAIDSYNEALAIVNKSKNDYKSEKINLQKKIAKAYAKYITVTQGQDADKAIQYCDLAISGSSDLKVVENLYFLKGDIYFYAKRYSEAITAYTNSLILFPNSKYAQQAYYRIGKAYNALNQKDVAIAYLTLATSINQNSQDFPTIALDLGKTLESVKRYKEALNIYKFLTANPSTPPYITSEASKRIQAIEVMLNG